MIKSEKLIKNNNGFTLLETIVAVSLIVVGLISALGLITTSLFYVSNIQDRLVAANLMAEGIEVARNIRDNNWLQSQPWNNGLANGDYQVAYNSMSLSLYSGNPLLLDSNGLYNYTSGATTPYVRKISIADLSNYEIQVISTVTWQRRGTTYSSSAEDHLFNWK
ncbi:MAG: prepilin-type N-terminal cleavage/methylation domain-containing protein [Candidatus Azambacteria bacterium]|nr:prepilin-type N-terminal cleavage/methylation domain-containing protein [Candidatus Azambacteria bacterium]